MTKKERRSKENLGLKRGCRIILKQGVRNKRKYNGREAKVMNYPSKGGWMTVAVLLSGETMKWRKGKYSAAPLGGSHVTQEQTHLHTNIQQHMDRLDDNVWTTIFGFLVGPVHGVARDENGREKQNPRDFIWVKKARNIHATLTAVRKSWREICNRNMLGIFGRINANLDAFRSTSSVVSHIHWMINHKISIGALFFNTGYHDIPLLEQLLNACDTSELTVLRAFIQEQNCTGWVRYAHRYLEREQDSRNRVRIEDAYEAIGVPANSSGQELRIFHDSIASNCKNLFELQVNLFIPDGTKTYNYMTTPRKKMYTDILSETGTSHRDHFSEALFSLNNLQILELSIELHFGTSSIIGWMLEKLVKIQELSIRSRLLRFNGIPTVLNAPRFPTGYPIFPYAPRRLHIASKTLKSLDISRFAKNFWISGDLPKLKTLVCKKNNGIVAQFTNEQKAKIERVGEQYAYSFFAGQATIHNLKIPRTCKVTVSEVFYRDTLFSEYYEEFRGSILC